MDIQNKMISNFLTKYTYIAQFFICKIISNSFAHFFSSVRSNCGLLTTIFTMTPTTVFLRWFLHHRTPPYEYKHDTPRKHVAICTAPNIM